MKTTETTETTEKTLNDREVAFICSVINHMGTGEHPVAEFSNIQYFKLPYVVDCLNAALESKALTGAGELLALSIKAKML